MNSYEALLFFLSENDLSKIEIIKNSNYEDCLKIIYLNKVETLNNLLDTLAFLQYIKKEERKK